MVKTRSLIGLSKVSNEWVWEDGTKASYTNWMPGQPSGDGSAVEIIQEVWTGDSVPGQWNDLPVNNTHPPPWTIKGYVCQYNPNKPSSGKLIFKIQESNQSKNLTPKDNNNSLF